MHFTYTGLGLIFFNLVEFNLKLICALLLCIKHKILMHRSYYILLVSEQLRIFFVPKQSQSSDIRFIACSALSNDLLKHFFIFQVEVRREPLPAQLRRGRTTEN